MCDEPLVRLKTKDEQRDYIIKELRKLAENEAEAKKYFRDRRERLYRQLKKVNGNG